MEATRWIELYEHHDKYKLVGRLRERAPVEVPVVVEEDALRLKGVIGSCHVTMCSRFHGLVSALSSGVPSISTSWSHKYEHLLDDYAYSESMVDPAGDPSALEERVANMLDPAQHEAASAQLSERARQHRAQAEQMWSRIDDLIEA